MKRLIHAIRYYGVFWILLQLIEENLHIRLPLGSKFRWKLSVKTETKFWDKYLGSPNGEYGEEYRTRLDPNTKLDDEVAELLPNQPSVSILDVGAGPLTCLGKTWDHGKLNITAVDPLADEYDKIIDRYRLKPVVRTRKLDAEKLSTLFPEATFDLAFARNAIDHSYSPEESVLQMLKVTKPGGHVLLVHSQNEAIKEKWKGLHQWNFSLEGGDFIISSKNGKVNFSRKYASICSTSVYHDAANDWIHVTLHKNRPEPDPASGMGSL